MYRFCIVNIGGGAHCRPRRCCLSDLFKHSAKSSKPRDNTRTGHMSVGRGHIIRFAVPAGRKEDLGDDIAGPVSRALGGREERALARLSRKVPRFDAARSIGRSRTPKEGRIVLKVAKVLQLLPYRTAGDHPALYREHMDVEGKGETHENSYGKGSVCTPRVPSPMRSSV